MSWEELARQEKVLKNENIGNKINSSNGSKEIVKEENPTFVEKKIEN